MSSSTTIIRQYLDNNSLFLANSAHVVTLLTHQARLSKELDVFLGSSRSKVKATYLIDGIHCLKRFSCAHDSCNESRSGKQPRKNRRSPPANHSSFSPASPPRSVDDSKYGGSYALSEYRYHAVPSASVRAVEIKRLGKPRTTLTAKVRFKQRHSVTKKRNFFCRS